MIYPPTRRENVSENIHGVEIHDPYRWLENFDLPETQKWVDEQNKLLDKELKDENFEIFTNELAKNFKVVNFGNPLMVNRKYFYTERQPDEDQSVLYVKDELDGTPKKLVDPNGVVEGNTITIDYWNPSRTGKYLIYGISKSGDEMATLFIKDVESGKDLEESIERCKYSNTKWIPDDSGFFYTRKPKEGSVPKDEEHLHSKVYFHKLGDDPDRDELIFGKDRPKDDMISLSISTDGDLLAINVGQKWTENDVYIYNNISKELKLLISNIPAKFGSSFLKDKMLIKTNYKANNFRVLYSKLDDIFKPIDEWLELIPEKKNLLQNFNITEDKVLAEYLVNACSKVEIYDHAGNFLGDIPLPQYSSLAGIASRREEKEFFFGVDSYTFPKIVYRYDPEKNQYSEYRKTENPIDPKNYVVKQEWFISKDGTKVPMFIFHKNDINKSEHNPTILYGYGGFGNNETPGFMRNWIPWVERGGIYCVANIRGGKEFGESWHQSGIKEKKQNSFDDFIAAAEYLVDKKYTNSKHLGIVGGSNGGLLVSAVSVQRPDLFKAVCSRVPLTDMVRFNKFGIAMRWVHEYGNPGIKEEFENILKWSPYHNVRENINYPSYLFTTADKDTRVDPLHARKMAAALQNTSKDSKVLVFTDFNSGHGPGKPVNKIVGSQAIILSFFSKELGIEIINC